MKSIGRFLIRVAPAALAVAFAQAWAPPVAAQGIVAVAVQPAEPLQLGSRMELFVDDYLIDTLRGVNLKLHEPQPMGTVLVFDRPWEGVTSGYSSVFQDHDLFRMYYRASSDPAYTMKSALRPGEKEIPEHPSFACYAESRDGIVWTRPSLGLFEFNGSRDNNIVWAGEGSHNFFVFRDDNPATPAAERYKAVGARNSDGDKRPPVLLGFVSPDGKRWRLAGNGPILSDGSFDSLNVAFWDAGRGEYVAIYRDFVHGVRSIKCARSKDFLHWMPGQLADFGGAPQQQLYTNATVPYFRAPQIYLAMPRRFFPRKTYFKEMEKESPGISDAVFMSSRDGVHWNRFEEAWIRPGLDERNWVHRSNTPADGILPTGPAEISIYMERNYTFPSNQIERLTLRTDGFVSANAGYPGGELVTKPMVFSGGRLLLNYSTSAIGSIRVEIEDAAGNPIPGFDLKESPLIFGDKIEGEVSWNRVEGQAGRNPLAGLAGRAVRLRFVMCDADLYSLQFK